MLYVPDNSSAQRPASADGPTGAAIDGSTGPSIEGSTCPGIDGAADVLLLSGLLTSATLETSDAVSENLSLHAE